MRYNFKFWIFAFIYFSHISFYARTHRDTAYLIFFKSYPRNNFPVGFRRDKPTRNLLIDRQQASRNLYERWRHVSSEGPRRRFERQFGYDKTSLALVRDPVCHWQIVSIMRVSKAIEEDEKAEIIHIEETRCRDKICWREKSQNTLHPLILNRYSTMALGRSGISLTEIELG